MISLLVRPFLCSTVLALAFFASAYSQSADPAFPTPITSGELSGTIKARDLGDARLTTYYYAFDGGQGDIFINITSRNLSADIDVFTETGLRPLTKIVIYPDSGASETGRLIYLRRPERLILRVQGRTPGDDPASFQIKFAGSFTALAPAKDDKPPTIENAGGETGVTVNSVGTIVAVKPKPRPTPKGRTGEPDTSAKVATHASKDRSADAQTDRKPAVVIKDFPGESEEAKPARVENKPKASVRRPPRKRAVAAPAKPKPPALSKTETVDPLAGVTLVVTMKNGTIVEKKLADLIRFSFDKGVLTLIGKDGNIVRYQMVDVARVNVQ